MNKEEHHNHQEPVMEDHNHMEGHPEDKGHSKHNHHEMMIQDFKKRFFISLILTLPILLLSPMIQTWLNINIVFLGSNYVLLALSSFIYFYGGLPFLKGIRDELREKSQV